MGPLDEDWSVEDRPVRDRPAENRSARLAVLGALALCLALIGVSAPSSAEPAWVRGGIRLNLRTEAGTQYRIIGVITTGDAVDILERGDGWTKVELLDGPRGWIPAGYLQSEPAPELRLEELESQIAGMRARLDSSEGARTELQKRNAGLVQLDAGQRDEIENLTRDNIELRAGKRWPEWITGASVLAAGMLLGSILRGNAQRRPQPRVRL